MTRPDPSDLKAAKRALRAELIQVRARVDKEARTAASRAIAARAAGIQELTSARTLTLYAALNTEVDPLPIGLRLASLGRRIAWPRVPASGRILEFATCELTALVRGPLGALEPPRDARPVPLDEIDAVIMPGVAFSLDGLRLGRGGGYYDATLKHVPPRALRVGLGFDVQVVPSLPREPHDVPLDLVLTELRTLRFPR